MINSFTLSPRRGRASSDAGYPSSTWIPESANWLVHSRTRGPNGPRPGVGQRSRRSVRGHRCGGSPAGTYDQPINRAAVVVGISHDTAAFAARSITKWWIRDGVCQYGRIPQGLVLADTAGSNGCRSRAWKAQLQTQLCNPFDLSVTVAHYLTGASKWNPIEHRLFSEISKNWTAEPLDSYQTMLNFVRTATTATGLLVSAYLDHTQYPTGLTPDPSQIRLLNPTRSHTLPEWNYTIAPNPNTYSDRKRTVESALARRGHRSLGHAFAPRWCLSSATNAVEEATTGLCERTPPGQRRDVRLARRRYWIAMLEHRLDVPQYCGRGGR